MKVFERVRTHSDAFGHVRMHLRCNWMHLAAFEYFVGVSEHNLQTTTGLLAKTSMKQTMSPGSYPLVEALCQSFTSFSSFWDISTIKVKVSERVRTHLDDLLKYPLSSSSLHWLRPPRIANLLLSILLAHHP